MAGVKLDIRKAVIEDAEKIQALVNGLARDGAMLALSLAEIYEHIRDFFVVEKDGAMVGTCALHIVWRDLAEVRSLAVDGCCRDLGIGRKLVVECLEEAQALSIGQIFALTYQPDFFRRMGFDVVDKNVLPHKVWSDCMKCTKFPNCDETAVLKRLLPES